MQVRGSLDNVDRSVVRDWVTTTGSETDRVMLDVLVGERVIGQVTAEQFRQGPAGPRHSATAVAHSKWPSRLSHSGRVPEWWRFQSDRVGVS
jgi:hypothetical protein